MNGINKFLPFQLIIYRFRAGRGLRTSPQWDRFQLTKWSFQPSPFVQWKTTDLGPLNTCWTNTMIAMRVLTRKSTSSEAPKKISIFQKVCTKKLLAFLIRPQYLIMVKYLDVNCAKSWVQWQHTWSIERSSLKSWRISWSWGAQFPVRPKNRPLIVSCKSV